MSSRIKNRRGAAVGAILAVATGIIAFTVSREMGRELFAVAMTLIGAVYYGFAFSEKPGKARTIEVITASLFVATALLGLWVSLWFIVAGLMLHGVWDLLHHNGDARLAAIPSWYIPLCVVYDWLAGGLLIVWILLG